MKSGILNLLKLPGMTSQDAVNVVRGIYRTKKVGHAGTLDPDAAGVLPVYLGTATKLLEYTAEDKKCYRVQGKLGLATDTGDDLGQVIMTKPVPQITEAEFLQALSKFQGHILQIPPMYSALKYKGKKLYEYARAGKNIPRPARPITIFRLERLYFQGDSFLLEVECSKGTYIRTLIEDIGKTLGTCAVMSFLLRTVSGSCHIEKALTLEEIAADPAAALLPLATAAQQFPKLAVNPLQAYRITCGVRTTIKGSAEGRQALYCQNQFLGVVQVDQEQVHALKIIARPDYKPIKILEGPADPCK